MTGSTITCLQCGQSNSIHRLWCATCGTPVAYSYRPPVFTADPSVAAKTQLYERILQDLEGLLIDRKVSRDTYDAIKSCYGDQLAEFEEQATERDRAQARHRLVVTARQAAHSGRFQDAIDLLQQGLADDRGEHQLEEVIAEVSEKLEQRERVLQASREADQQPWTPAPDTRTPSVRNLSHEGIGYHVRQPRKHQDRTDRRQADAEPAGIVCRNPDSQRISNHRQRQP